MCLNTFIHVHKTSLIVEITITAVFFSRNEPTILAGAMNGQIIHRADGVYFQCACALKSFFYSLIPSSKAMLIISDASVSALRRISDIPSHRVRLGNLEGSEGSPPFLSRLTRCTYPSYDSIKQPKVLGFAEQLLHYPLVFLISILSSYQRCSRARAIQGSARMLLRVTTQPWHLF